MTQKWSCEVLQLSNSVVKLKNYPKSRRTGTYLSTHIDCTMHCTEARPQKSLAQKSRMKKTSTKQNTAQFESTATVASSSRSSWHSTGRNWQARAEMVVGSRRRLFGETDSASDAVFNPFPAHNSFISKTATHNAPNR